MRLTGDEDRRVRRTITSLKNAYIKLLEEKDSHKITVTELSEKAMINKKTFYSYYSSLEDLQNEMVEEAIDNFVDRIRPYDLNDFRHITQVFYDYFSDKKVFLLNVLTPKGAEYIYKRTEEVAAQETREGFLKAAALDNPHRHFIFVFMINGLIMLFAKWFDEGRKIPKDEAVQMTADLLENGAGMYLSLT